MSNHPNRGPKGPCATPKPEEIKALRQSAGLTQAAAAALVHSGIRRLQEWEAGTARMHPGLWELFKIKLGKHS